MPKKDYPIVRRFFVAIEHYLLTSEINEFKAFCLKYDLPRANILRIRKEPYRKFHPEWLAVMAKLGYSAHWLLTGEGEMKPKKQTVIKKKKLEQKENA
ncbi:hypothetical protein [Riemerella columbina]|uniref:hypothetical protein n=1 Tax=Riemerella columbina TaxID=103810 RepID=UPI00035FC53A|nr:hypothetical protein [Riemerella columbina]